jgi:hypothetical protein
MTARQKLGAGPLWQPRRLPTEAADHGQLIQRRTCRLIRYPPTQSKRKPRACQGFEEGAKWQQGDEV